MEVELFRNLFQQMMAFQLVGPKLPYITAGHKGPLSFARTHTHTHNPHKAPTRYPSAHPLAIVAVADNLRDAPRDAHHPEEWIVVALGGRHVPGTALFPFPNASL